MSQFNCVVPFIPPISRYNHHDICLNKTENEIEKVMALFVKSASNTTQGACMLPCASMEVKNFIDLLVRADRTKGGVLYLVFCPRTILNCIVLNTLSSKAKQLKNVLGHVLDTKSVF